MKKEKLEEANKIQNRIISLDMIKKRVDNENGNSKLTFGISTDTFSTHFCPIMFEESLNKELTAITKKYCNEKLIELQEQFDKL